MLNYLQKLTAVAMGIFLSSVIFPSYLTTPHDSIVYAAVVSCGPATDPRWDPCNGTYGDDNMKGDPEYNKMNGLDGNDRLSGESGNDFLHGGYGNDQLSGGSGDEILYGSVGADSFRCGQGNDRIIEFNPSEGDTKSNDCENIGYGNHTGVSNDTLTGFPVNLTGFTFNHTMSANNSSSP